MAEPKLSREEWAARINARWQEAQAATYLAKADIRKMRSARRKEARVHAA